jgi:hypothetical protein
MKITALLSVVLLAGSTLAQTPSAPAPEPTPAQTADHPLAPAPVATVPKNLPDPKISKSQMYAIQSIDKLAEPLLKELRPLNDQRQEVIREILNENPGYEWNKNPQTGGEGLVPKRVYQAPAKTTPTTPHATASPVTPAKK